MKIAWCYFCLAEDVRWMMQVILGVVVVRDVLLEISCVHLKLSKADNLGLWRRRKFKNDRDWLIIALQGYTQNNLVNVNELNDLWMIKWF